MRLVLFLTAICGSIALFATETAMQTIGSLPDNRPIHGSPADLSKAITFYGSFKKQVEVSRVVDGNWITVTYRVAYSTEPQSHFPFSEISFTAIDSVPTKESGILAKKPAWPFVEGRMVFYVLKDQDYGSPKFFRILFYKKQKS